MIWNNLQESVKGFKAYSEFKVQQKKQYLNYERKNA